MRRLCTFKQLKEAGYPYTRTHTWRLVKAGLFPAPIRLGPGRVAWFEDEVDRWIAARVQCRDEGQAPKPAIPIEGTGKRGRPRKRPEVAQ